MLIQIIKKLSVKKMLFISILPPVILALILLSIVSSIYIYKNVEKQTGDNNQLFIDQALSYLETAYQQDLETCIQIYDNEALRDVLSISNFRNKMEELQSEKKISFNDTNSGQISIRQIAEQKIDGACYILDLDQSSLIDQTDYKLYRVTDKYFTVRFNVKKIINDPLFKMALKNGKFRMTVGVMGKEAVIAGEGNIIPVLIYPIRYNENDQVPDKFILIFKIHDSIHKTYQNIPSLKYGTFYILDPLFSVLDKNHPSSRDYFEFDPDKKVYINPDQDSFDDEGMSFNEYQLLNTDDKILTIPQIQKLLRINPMVMKVTIENNHRLKKKYIQYQGKNYLYQTAYSTVSEFSLIYFYPVQRMIKPMVDQIIIVLIVLVVLSGVLTMALIFLTRIFDRPIFDLTRASYQITMGNYEEQVNPDHLFGEFTLLGDSFNLMTQTVKKYQVHLEKLIQKYDKFIPNKFLTLLNKKSILEINLGDQHQRDMTILFSDIRDFTMLSEKMNPQENFNFLNSYFRRIGPVIRKHNGFVDKYIGDAIMALFQNDPQEAVDASIDLLKELEIYNVHRLSRNYLPVKTGIGINTGSMMFGIIGEDERFEGTVISDAVNLSARLESLTKVYGCRIIISIFTVLYLNADQYHFRFLDNVRVKGKEEETLIAEVLNGLPAQEYDLKMKTKPRFEEAVREFFTGNILNAESIFKELKKESDLDKAVDVYLTRCRETLLLSGQKS